MNEIIPLVSFPKSGNTWMRFLLANIFKRNKEEAVNFKNIHKFTGTSKFGKLDSIKNNIIENGPIFIKEHVNYKNMEYYDFKKAIYIYRNGFDVLYSYWYFTDAQSPGLYNNINQFTRCYWSYCGHWGDHLNSWLIDENKKNAPKVLPVCYENLMDNPLETMLEVVNFLGYDIDKNSIKKAILESDKKHMKNLSGSKQFMKAKKQNFHFVRNAKTNDSKKNLPNSCKNYFLKNKINFEMMKKFAYVPKESRFQKKHEVIPQHFCDFLLNKYRHYKYTFNEKF